MNVDFWLVLALGPAAALLLFFCLQDRYEPEPWWLVLRVCLFGALACIPAFILEVVGQTAINHFGHQPLQRTDILLLTFFIALCEEVVKFLAVYLTVYRHPEFDEVSDGITYCVAAALGFASVENLLYIAVAASHSTGEGVSTALMRGLLSVPAHALFGAIMGYFVGRARFAEPEQEPRYLLTAIGLSMALHGTWDFIIFASQGAHGALPPLAAYSVLALMGLMWILALYLIRVGQGMSPFNPELYRGLVPPPGWRGYSQTDPKLYMPPRRAETPSWPPPPLPSATNPNLNFCPNCGHRWLPGTRFCTQCGSPPKR
ncbi:MAG: PrsW family glutamic-type intramembrane protease [Candidatus Xenobia bacterium]